jgi:hypothetical protein
VGGISFLGGVRSHKLYAHRHQLFLGLGRMVIAVPDEHTRGSFGDLGHYRELVGVGRGHREASDDPRPAHPRVHPQTVEGLLEEGVLAEGRLAAKALAPVGTGKQASRIKGIESQMAKAGS